MKKEIKILMYFIIFVLLIFVISRLKLKNTFSILFSLNIFYLNLYVFVIFLLFVFLTYRWKLILNFHSNAKIKFSFKTLLKYRLISYAISYITPFALIGGEPVRAWLVRKKIRFNKALSATLIDKLLDVIIDICFLLISFFIIIFKYTFKNHFFMIFFIFFIFISISFFVIVLTRLSRGKSILSPFVRIFHLKKIKFLNNHISILFDTEREIMLFLKKNKKILIFLLLFYSLIIAGLMYFEYFFLLLSLNIHNFSLFLPFILLTVIGFSFIIPVPAALGSMELFLISFFVVINLNPGAGLALILIVRFKDAVLTIIGLTSLMQTDVNLNKLKKLEETELNKNK